MLTVTTSCCTLRQFISTKQITTTFIALIACASLLGPHFMGPANGEQPDEHIEFNCSALSAVHTAGICLYGLLQAPSVNELLQPVQAGARKAGYPQPAWSKSARKLFFTAFNARSTKYLLFLVDLSVVIIGLSAVSYNTRLRGRNIAAVRRREIQPRLINAHVRPSLTVCLFSVNSAHFLTAVVLVVAVAVVSLRVRSYGN